MTVGKENDRDIKIRRRNGSRVSACARELVNNYTENPPGGWQTKNQKLENKKARLEGKISGGQGGEGDKTALAGTLLCERGEFLFTMRFVIQYR